MATTNKIELELTAVDRTMAAFSSLQNNLGKLNSFGATVKRTLAAVAASAAFYKFGEGIKNVIDKADGMRDLSQKTGIAVETLNQFAFAAEQSGTNMEGVAKGLKALSANMTEAAAGNKSSAAIFDALGISVKNSDGSMKGSAEVMVMISDKFAGLEDGALKATLAQKLFGKAGMELIPMLNQGSESIGKYASAIDTSFANAADKFNDKLVEMKYWLESIFVKLSPPIMKFFDDMSASYQRIDTDGKAANLLFKAFQDILTSIVATSVAVIGTLRAIGDTLVALAEASSLVSEGKFSEAMDALATGASSAWSELGKTKDQMLELLRTTNAVKAVMGEPLSITVTKSGGKPLEDTMAMADATREFGKAVRQTTIDQNALNTALGAGGESPFAKFLIDQQKEIDQLALEREAVGLSASEYAIRSEALKYDAEVAKLVQVQTGANVEAFKQEAEALKQSKLEAMARNEEFKKSFEGGMLDGLKRVREEFTNVGQAVSDTWVNAFQSMEDAFVNFVKTGKLDFKSLADSIIADLARIAFRQMISGLFGGSSTGFNLFSFLGGGKAVGGSVSSSMPYLVGEKGPEIFMPNRSGSIVPNSNLGGMNGGNVSVNIINNSNAQATAKETVDGRGNRKIDVVIGEVVAKEIGRIGSSVNQSIRNTFQTSPALVGR